MKIRENDTKHDLAKGFWGERKKIEMRVKLKQCFGGWDTQKKKNICFRVPSDTAGHAVASRMVPIHTTLEMPWLSSRNRSAMSTSTSCPYQCGETRLFLSGLLEPLKKAARMLDNFVVSRNRNWVDTPMTFQDTNWACKRWQGHYQLQTFDKPTFWGPSNVTCLMYFVYFSLAKTHQGFSYGFSACCLANGRLLCYQLQNQVIFKKKLTTNIYLGPKRLQKVWVCQRYCTIQNQSSNPAQIHQCGCPKTPQHAHCALSEAPLKQKT